MHPVIENILDRPLGQKIAIWLGSIVLALAAFWQLSLSGKLNEQAALEEEVVKLDSDIATERRIAARLDKAREKLQELEMSLKVALEQLPDKSEIDDLLERISNIARESGLELNLFKRKEDSIKEFYAEVPVELSVTGSYHQVATFFDEVGRLPRIVNISQLAVVDPKITDAEVSVRVDGMLTAFRYLNEQERANQQTSTDKKKRR